MSDFSLQKDSGWKSTEKVLTSLKKNMYSEIKKYVQEVGDEAVQIIRRHIEMQDLGWTPLSPVTVQKKRSSDAWVETGTLKESVKTIVEKDDGKDFSLFVGVPRNGYNADGTSLADIAYYLEYGTVHIPARPLIRPTTEEVQQILKQAGMKNVLVNLINKSK